MNIALIRTFLEILETKNLQKAAKRLHVTQSTVTVRMNTLEDLLGQKLFVRSKSGAELTYAGFMFQRYAEMFMQLWRQSQQAISLPPNFSGLLNIGFERDLWAHLAEPWLLAMRSDMPSVALGMWPGNPENLARWLSSGLVSLALTYGLQIKAGIEVDPLYDEKIILVSTTPRNFTADPLGHEWVEDYVFIDRGEELSQQHAMRFPAQTVAAVTFGEEQVALDYMLAVGGYAYVSERIARPYLSSGRLFPVVDAPLLSRQVYVGRATNSHQTQERASAEVLLRAILEKT